MEVVLLVELMRNRIQFRIKRVFKSGEDITVVEAFFRMVTYFCSFFSNLFRNPFLSVWVLTAGHCHDDDIENIKVVGGAHDLREKNGHEQEKAVAVFIKHEDYPGGTEPNDIAIIKLAEPFELNKYVQQIGLMSSGSATGKGLASGWGTNVADDPNPKPYPILQVIFQINFSGIRMIFDKQKNRKQSYKSIHMRNVNQFGYKTPSQKPKFVPVQLTVMFQLYAGIYSFSLKQWKY